MSSTKLQGLCVDDNWNVIIDDHASLHADGEPGKQKIYVAFDTPAHALLWRAEVLILS